jgi:hypothetical protein
MGTVLAKETSGITLAEHIPKASVEKGPAVAETKWSSTKT